MSVKSESLQTPATVTVADQAEAEHLLPCPFCGKQQWSGWIDCNVPGMGDLGSWGILCCIVNVSADSKEESLAIWNSRSGRTLDGVVHDGEEAHV